MVHQLLPSSKVNPSRARTQPDAFADTGIPRLLKALATMGINPRQASAFLVGGAAMGLNASDTFKVGKRNILAARQVLWRLGVPIRGEDVGKNIPRTAILVVEDGCVLVRVPGRPDRRLG